MKRSKSIYVALSMLLAIVLVLSACGKSNNNNAQSSPPASSSSAPSSEAPSSEAPSSEAPKSPVKLSMLINKDWYNESFQNIIKRYEEKTGNTIEVQVTPGGQPFQDALTGKTVANELPDIIAWYGTESSIKSVRGEELFLDITSEEFAKKITPSILAQPEFLKAGGKLYGIPAGAVNVAGVIYNKKVFAANSIEIPKTWDEFLAVSEKLKSANVVPIYEAAKDGWPTLLYHFLLVANVVQKDKANILEDINTGKMDLNASPEFKLVLEKLKELIDKGYYNKDAASATYDSQVAAIAEGKAAMMIQADWAIPVLLEKYPDAGPDLGMFPLPVVDEPIIAYSDPWGLYLAKDSKNLEASKGFFEYFTSDENLNTYFGELKGMPSYVGISTELNPGTADMVGIMADGKAAPFYTALLTPGVNFTFDRVSLFMKGKTIDQILDESQKAYIKSGKDAKVPGF